MDRTLFIENQSKILSRTFRRTAEEIVFQGIARDPTIPVDDSSEYRFGVWLRLDEEFSRWCAQQSACLLEAGALTYNEASVHVTLLNFGPSTDPNDATHRDLSQKICGKIGGATDLWSNYEQSTPAIVYSSDAVLQNPNCRVVVGVPNEALWTLRERVVGLAQEVNPTITGGWGCHTTLARFQSDHDLQKEQQDHLLVELPTPDFTSARVTSVECGRFCISKRGFQLLPDCQFRPVLP